MPFICTFVANDSRSHDGAEGGPRAGGGDGEGLTSPAELGHRGVEGRGLLGQFVIAEVGAARAVEQIAA